MDTAKFKKMFLDETTEHLERIVRILLHLDNDPEDQTEIDALFREAHSIKGMAATMEYERMARLAHHLEDHLDHCRKAGQISRTEIDWFLEAGDLLEALLDDIRNDRPERSVDTFIATLPQEKHEISPVVSGEETSSDPTDKPQPLTVQLTLRDTVAAPGPRFLVLLKQLADFGSIVSSTPTQEELLEGDTPSQLLVQLETTVPPEEIHLQFEKYSEIESISFLPAAEKTVSHGKKAPLDKTVRISTELLDHFINLTGELITNRYQLQNALKNRDWNDLDEGVGQLTRLVKNLHHQVLQVRMVSLESLAGRLSRAVHDLSRSSNKEITFHTEGMKLELDRAIVEELADPLIHMVRNAIDHGIETAGTVSVRAWRERDQIMIEIADNGNGINLEKIRQRAIKVGLLTPEQAKSIRNYDLLQLICQPGFSTVEEVNETSGRGVGMDVVKTAVERVGGILLIDSTAGEGTRFTLKLPLSLAIIRVLIVACADIHMAMPITRVVQTVEISANDVQSSGKQLMIHYQNKLLPLLSLRKILKLPKGEHADPISVVITEVLGRRIGLVVDQLVRQQEVFIQRLPAPFDQIRGCNGGTILGSGEIIFLLDLQTLFERRRDR